MKYSAILLAGGMGSRVDKTMPKQFLMLAGKPVIIHSLEKLEKISEVDEVIVVCIKGFEEYIRDYIEKYNLKKTFKMVVGGNTRQESVFNGLKEVKNNAVIIHEAARPFVNVEEFQKLISTPTENVSYGISPTDTVLGVANNQIEYNLMRENLINIQLPQKFNKQLLLESHELAIKERKNFTDDASLLFNYKKSKIQILKGNSYNIKLTTYIDFLIGEEIYKEYMVKSK